MKNKEYNKLIEETEAFSKDNAEGMFCGFDLALREVRRIDKEIEYPQIASHESEFIKYNSQKDLLYRIYEAIQKRQAREFISSEG
jgi:hypothetical protein